MILRNYVTKVLLRNYDHFDPLSISVGPDCSFGLFMAILPENSRNYDYYVTLPDDVIVKFHHDFRIL